MTILISGLFFPRSISAASNFHTSLKTTYVVNTRTTLVTHLITITNKTPTLYAKQYGLKLSSASIKNVKVVSNGQTIPAEVVTTETQTSIGITFPDEIVGEGKARNLEVSYQNPDVSVVSGQVLEVLVPKLASANEYDEYQVTIVTPQAFGRPTRATPADFSATDNGQTLITTFSPKNGESVTALFGTEQNFTLDLIYHLQNTGPNPGLAQIALPPDTQFQKMSYSSLEPRPQKLESDADGNWIATYQISPQTTLEVKANLQAWLTLTPQTQRLISHPEPELTQDQPFWETQNPLIKDVSQTHTSPRAIYDYVVETLAYNYDRLQEKEVERLGAAETLTTPDQAICQEFTDTFIALARASGIPARRLAGYAHTENSVLRPLSLVEDVLHAWPEYYDQDRQLWVPIDPTWGNTTGGINYFDQLDLNHIVFAINGYSSETPYPAGSYKLADTQSKDVSVIFGSLHQPTAADFEFELQPQKFFGLISWPGLYTLELTNRTGVAWYDIAIELDPSQPEVELDQALIKVPRLLPFQTQTYVFKASTNQNVATLPTPIQLRVSYANDQTITNQAREKLNPVNLDLVAGGHFFQILSQPWAAITVGAGCLVGTLLTGSLLVYRRSRQRVVRR